MAAEPAAGQEQTTPALQALFPSARLVIAANRAPYRRTTTAVGDAEHWERPAGGLTAALDPMMRSSGGVWVAASPGESTTLEVPPEDPAYTVVSIGVPPDTYRGYYNGYANSGLWPLCHNLVERAHFRMQDWQRYRQVNEMFADHIAQLLQPQDVLWIHDYHLTLLPALLRERGCSQPIGLFWHIPWPPTTVLRLCPERRQLLQGMLAADWIGFQTEDAQESFLSAAKRELSARPHRGQLLRLDHAGHRTVVAVEPISIDAELIRRIAHSADTERRMQRFAERLGHDENSLLFLGVDRLDYTKGIPARLEAFEKLLLRHPFLLGRARLVQVGVPSRTEIEDYRHLATQVRERARNINRKLARPGWMPVRLIERNLKLEQLVALYRLADVAVVSSIYDGLNLVAKEYVAARVDGGGALCLSETAGAYYELRAAFPLSPLSPERMAEGMARAIFSSPAERHARMRELQSAVAQNTIHDWLARSLRGVATARLA